MPTADSVWRSFCLCVYVRVASTPLYAIAAQCGEGMTWRMSQAGHVVHEGGLCLTAANTSLTLQACATPAVDTQLWEMHAAQLRPKGRSDVAVEVFMPQPVLDQGITTRLGNASLNGVNQVREPPCA